MVHGSFGFGNWGLKESLYKVCTANHTRTILGSGGFLHGLLLLTRLAGFAAWGSRHGYMDGGSEWLALIILTLLFA